MGDTSTSPLSAVSAVGQAASGIGGLAYNIFSGERQWKAYKNERNYQRNMDTLKMEREDNAIRRKVEDLKAAGLHPTLAVGGGASGGASVSGGTPTPQPSMSGVQTKEAQEAFMSHKALEQADAQISLTRAESARLANENKNRDRQLYVQEYLAGLETERDYNEKAHRENQLGWQAYRENRQLEQVDRQLEQKDSELKQILRMNNLTVDKHYFDKMRLRMEGNLAYWRAAAQKLEVAYMQQRHAEMPKDGIGRLYGDVVDKVGPLGAIATFAGVGLLSAITKRFGLGGNKSNTGEIDSRSDVETTHYDRSGDKTGSSKTTTESYKRKPLKRK